MLKETHSTTNIIISQSKKVQLLVQKEEVDLISSKAQQILVTSSWIHIEEQP